MNNKKALPALAMTLGLVAGLSAVANANPTEAGLFQMNEVASHGLLTAEADHNHDGNSDSDHSGNGHDGNGHDGDGHDGNGHDGDDHKKADDHKCGDGSCG